MSKAPKHTIIPSDKFNRFR